MAGMVQGIRAGFEYPDSCSRVKLRQRHTDIAPIHGPSLFQNMGQHLCGSGLAIGTGDPDGEGFGVGVCVHCRGEDTPTYIVKKIIILTDRIFCLLKQRMLGWDARGEYLYLTLVWVKLCRGVDMVTLCIGIGFCTVIIIESTAAT
jgi:hypothetical protein